jgi:CheY-like chemotaxis protein
LIAVSGYGREEDQRRCREAGFDHHLTKPVDPEELRRFLPALLAGV